MSLPDINHLLATLKSRLEAFPAITDHHFIGIERGGMHLARWLHKELKIQGQLGSLDISFYRDDFAHMGLNPRVKPSNIPFDINNFNVIVVDDVIMTGRTIRAALNEIFDFGRPKTIRLACLIDLEEYQLPIRPDITATTMHLPANQRVELRRESNTFSLQLVEHAIK